MHFFRILWSDNIEFSEFTIKNTIYETLSLQDIVFKDDKNNKFLKYKSNLLIKHNNSKSIIEFIQKDIYFDESGFFNPGINWRGEMSKQRIADWLPYEYSITPKSQ